jgi:hypothetical protein
MIDQETAEKMYIEQNELLVRTMKEQLKGLNRDKFRLFLNVLEVIGILAIAVFLWR